MYRLTAAKMATISDRVLLPANVKPVHYNLVLTPDLTTFEFTGSVSIDLLVVSACNSISLHCKEISVSKATYCSDGISKEAVRINYDLKLTTVTFEFSDNFETGLSGVLKIEYTGILNNQMAGFYRSKYTDVDGKETYMASTQFEALDARRALPCWCVIFIQNMIRQNVMELDMKKLRSQ